MPEKKDNPIYAVLPKETVQLTNWMIRTTLVVAVRLPTSIALAIARRIRRKRDTW